MSKNKLAWLVLAGFFVLFLGVFCLVKSVIDQNPLLSNPYHAVTTSELSTLLDRYPQDTFKQCIAKYLSNKARLSNLDVYRCEESLNITIRRTNSKSKAP